GQFVNDVWENPRRIFCNRRRHPERAQRAPGIDDVAGKAFEEAHVPESPAAASGRRRQVTRPQAYCCVADDTFGFAAFGLAGFFSSAEASVFAFFFFGFGSADAVCSAVSGLLAGPVNTTIGGCVSTAGPSTNLPFCGFRLDRR